jgi:hypothetical protein
MIKASTPSFLFRSDGFPQGATDMAPAATGFAKTSFRQPPRRPAPDVDVDLQAVCSRCRQAVRGDHICVYKLKVVISR